MPKICPLRDNRMTKNIACLEENCALWVEKGDTEIKKADEGQRTTYSPVGCCALKAIAMRIQ